jgi:hypothetical protein
VSEAPGEVPSLRTAEDVHAFVLQMETESRALAADVGNPSRPLAAGEALARTVALRQKWERLRAWAIEQEVQDFTVPDYLPREVGG